MTDEHPDKPMGTSTLRFVPGQGYVNCPHLFRVTIDGSNGLTASYEVQSFYGRSKAEVIALEVHRARARWPVVGTRVEELGPTAPGGSPTAFDDRDEW